MMLPYMEQTTIYNAINFSVVSQSNNNNEDLLQLTGTSGRSARSSAPRTRWCPIPSIRAGPRHWSTSSRATPISPRSARA